MSMHTVDQLKAKWKKQMGAAKIAWRQLTEDELLESEGNMEKLVALVQERYSVTRDEANRRVNNFFEMRD